MSQSLALVGESLTPSVTFDVGGTATAPTGTPTVAVTDIAGAAVSTGSVTVASTTVSTTIAARSTPDVLTLAWSATVSGASRVRRTYIEIVGGEYFSLYDLRNSDAQRGTVAAARPISDASKWPAELLAAARQEAEDEAMDLMGHSCVRRASACTVTVGGDGMIRSPFGYVRSIRSATLVNLGPTTLTVTDWEVHGIYADRIYAPGLCYGDTVQLIIEHGCDGPPAQVSQACLLRARHVLSRSITNQPETSERARPVDGGGVIYLAQPNGAKTGNSWVDAIYARHSTRIGIA